jgi:hypothetical protein
MSRIGWNAYQGILRRRVRRPRRTTDSVVAMNSDVKFHAPIGRSFPPSPRSTPPSTRDTPRTTARGRVVTRSRQQPKAADLFMDRGGEVLVAPMSPSGWRGGRGDKVKGSAARGQIYTQHGPSSARKTEPRRSGRRAILIRVRGVEDASDTGTHQAVRQAAPTGSAGTGGIKPKADRWVPPCQ